MLSGSSQNYNIPLGICLEFSIVPSFQISRISLISISVISLFSASFFTSLDFKVLMLLSASSTSDWDDYMFIELEYKLIYKINHNEKN